jgi:hypothetical protein
MPAQHLTDKAWYEPEKAGNHTNGLVFRDPAYIPVLIRLGTNVKKDGEDPKDAEKPADKDAAKPADKDEEVAEKASIKDGQLLADVILPFAQYGVRSVVMFEGGNFDDKSLSLTFNDTGEQTNVSFAGKASASNATSLFSTAASTASTIAAGFAARTTNEMTASQNAADKIYQDYRLQQCQTNPASCTNK